MKNLVKYFFNLLFNSCLKFEGSTKVSSKFRVYRFLVFIWIFPNIYCCSCVQLSKEVLLIVLHLLSMLRNKGTKIGKTKFAESCKFVNSKSRAHFVSPIRRDVQALIKEIQGLTEKRTMCCWFVTSRILSIAADILQGSLSS